LGVEGAALNAREVAAALIRTINNRIGLIQPGSPANNAGLQRGDVIMKVNRRPVKSASEVAQALSGVPSGEDALVLAWSNGGSTFRVLHPSQG
jgi:serine protease Do